MKTNGLFPLPEFNVSNAYINVVCNYPEQNETNHLFDAQYFRNSLVAVKGGDASAVLFAAIVGVPQGDQCQGTGDKIGNCLADPA